MDALKTFAFLLMFRVPPQAVDEYLLGRLEPYFGIGFSVNQVEVGPMRTFDSLGNPVAANVSNDSSVGLGYVVSLGMNFIISDHWKLYGEYKYAEASFPFLDDLDEGTFGEDFDTSFDISDNTFMFGVIFSFGPLRG